MHGLCFGGWWRWTRHFLLVIWLSLLAAAPPKAYDYLLGDTKAVLNGCEDHWTLQDSSSMPLLSQMTLCVDIRVVVPGAWVAFSYSSVHAPRPELGLEGDDEALYGWLLRVRHRFPIRLSPTHWHRVCLRRDVSRNSFSLEVDGEMVAERTVIAQAIPPTGSLWLGCRPRDRPPGATLGDVELYMFRMWADLGHHGLCEDGTVIGWNAQSWGLTSPRARQRDPSLLCGDHRRVRRGAHTNRMETNVNSITPSANHSTEKKSSSLQNSSVTPSTNVTPLTTPVNPTTASSTELPTADWTPDHTSTTTTLPVNRTTPGGTLSSGSPLVNCNISQLCSDNNALFWITISVNTSGDTMAEKSIVNWVENIFDCGTTHFRDFCQEDGQLLVEQVDCTEKNNRGQTTCDVLLKLDRTVSVCELQRAGVSALQQTPGKLIQARITRDVERVARDVCGDVEPSSGGFVTCASTSPLDEICQASKHPELKCSLKEPDSIPAPQPNTESCSNEVSRFCDCTAFCNSTSQFFAIRININSTSVDVDFLKRLLSGYGIARTCNAMSGSECQDVFKHYRHAHLECHGTQQRLYSCMVILEMSGPVNSCLLNALVQRVIDSESSITYESPLTRMVVCGPPGLEVNTLLASNLTWVASDLLTSDVCQADPTWLECSANESLAVLLTDSCPPEPPSTKHSTMQPGTSEALTPSATSATEQTYTTAENTPRAQQTNASQATAQPNVTTTINSTQSSTAQPVLQTSSQNVTGTSDSTTVRNTPSSNNTALLTPTENTKLQNTTAAHRNATEFITSSSVNSTVQMTTTAPNTTTLSLNRTTEHVTMVTTTNHTEVDNVTTTTKNYTAGSNNYTTEYNVTTTNTVTPSTNRTTEYVTMVTTTNHTEVDNVTTTTKNHTTGSNNYTTEYNVTTANTVTPSTNPTTEYVTMVTTTNHTEVNNVTTTTKNHTTGSNNYTTEYNVTTTNTVTPSTNRTTEYVTMVTTTNHTEIDNVTTTTKNYTTGSNNYTTEYNITTTNTVTPSTNRTTEYVTMVTTTNHTEIDNVTTTTKNHTTGSNNYTTEYNVTTANTVTPSTNRTTEYVTMVTTTNHTEVDNVTTTTKNYTTGSNNYTTEYNITTADSNWNLQNGTNTTSNATLRTFTASPNYTNVNNVTTVSNNYTNNITTTTESQNKTATDNVTTTPIRDTQQSTTAPSKNTTSTTAGRVNATLNNATSTKNPTVDNVTSVVNNTTKPTVALPNNHTGNHTTARVTHNATTTTAVISTAINLNQTASGFNMSSTASSLTTDFNLTTHGPGVNLTTTAANASLEATTSTTTTAKINTTTPVVSLTTTLPSTTLTNTTTTKPGTGTTSTTIAETTASQEAQEEQANQLLNQTQDASQLNSSQVAQLVGNLEKLLDGPTVSQAVGQNAVNIISNLMEGDSLALSASANRLIQLVDDLGLKLVVTGDKEVLSSVSLVLAVREVDGTNFPGTSVDIFNTDNVQLRALSRSRSKRSGSALGSVFLPSSLTTGLSPEQQKQANRVQFTFYAKSALFQDAALDNKTLVSPVLASSVANLSISNLTENIRFTIRNINPVHENHTASCAFWDFTQNGGGGGWSSAGCFVVDATQEATTCSCNHLTSFAILMDLSREGMIDRQQAQILTFITYIGCGISAIFLALTLLTYLSFEKLLRDVPAKILVQLCLSLLLLNLVFLLDGWLALYPAIGLCISTAFFLHYFLLTSFTWAGLEALHMYLSIVRVFTPYLSRYMLKFSLMGWGIPLLVVIVVISVDKDNYGLVTYGKYRDGSSDDFCWLRNDIAFYVGVVAYFILIFGLCLLVFIVVLIQLYRIKKQNPQNQPPNRGVMTDLRSIAGLIVLLGLTWGFALFAWGPLYLPFVYLFTIFNSLQGFLVFIFHCAVKESVRRQWRTYLCCGRLRLAENSDWSRTATQNNKNMSVATASTSAPHLTTRSSSVISNATSSSDSVFRDSGISDGTNSDTLFNEIHDRTLSL